MSLLFGNSYNASLFIHLAKNSLKYDKVFEKYSRKLFKNPKNKNSKFTFEKALNQLAKEHKMIDLVGKNDLNHLFYAENILEMIESDLKKLEANFDDDNLIIDFDKTTDNEGELLGVKIFKIKDSPTTTDIQMIRRSNI